MLRMSRGEGIGIQEKYVNAMINNLPILRAAATLTQATLAEKVAVSRQTIVAIETRKRPMPWSLYLALVCVFEQYEKSKKILDSFELFDGDFIKEIIGKV